MSWLAPARQARGACNGSTSFFNESDGVRPLVYSSLLRPGQVSVIDLSDSGSSELNSIVIADLLRGLQKYRETESDRSERRAADARPDRHRGGPRVPQCRADRQDAPPLRAGGPDRQARPQRWLGLVFVTQLPQHLPRQVFGLVNCYVLHKITDPQVVSTLQHTVSGIDSWPLEAAARPGTGQAIVSFPHMTRARCWWPSTRRPPSCVSSIKRLLCRTSSLAGNYQGGD